MINLDATLGQQLLNVSIGPRYQRTATMIWREPETGEAGRGTGTGAGWRRISPAARANNPPTQQCPRPLPMLPYHTQLIHIHGTSVA